MKLNEINIRDPYILAENGKYYMYGTRGEGCWDVCSGFDVYTSNDLENWSEPVSVFEKTEDFWATHQFWAPEVHKYCGKYYMFASFKADVKCRATHILVSDAPNKTFTPLTSNPITPEDMECLDGTLYVTEEGEPWLVFCHEWKQAVDGGMCAVRLTKDLKKRDGEVITLFRGSSPRWSKPYAEGQYITDGPFLYRGKGGRLYMLWSTICNGYKEAVAVSDNGKIDGNWTHCDEYLFADNGGHGMIFTDFDGELKFIMHAPNKTPNERPHIFAIEEKNGFIVRKGG